MSHYKVREIHPDWLREDSTEVDERSRILVEELNRKLTEQRAATDVTFEASKPGFGVWLRIDADRNPLVALAGIERAACRRPWRQRSADDIHIQDTLLGYISKADLSGCQMRDQILRAIFKEFFSQLRLLRPVAMLHLAGCGLTKTCAQLFSWCAVNLELTRLDVSNNPEFSFQEESPMAELDLQGFSSFVRRSVCLEALQMHHTGFSNPQLISMCLLLGTMGKDKLKHISIGPPRDLIVTAEGCQLQCVPFSDECLAAIASMIRILTSVDLVVIHGLSLEQTEALGAAAPSRLHGNTTDGCLRLSSASRDAVEWAEFGPVELDERLLIQPRVHTMDAEAEAGDEHMMQQHGRDDVPAAALARAPGKLHVSEHAQQAADPSARAHAVWHQQPRRRHRRRPQSGGQRRTRPDAERQVRRRKKRRPAAGSFLDDAAGVAAVGGEVPGSYAAFIDNAAGGAAVGREVAESYAARAVGSGNEHSHRSSTSEGSEASSDSDLNSADAYPEEDWAALEQAAAGAAYTDALSDDSLSEQEPELRAERPQHDAQVRQQALGPRQADRVARPDQEHTASGHAPARAVPATGLASPRTPRRQSRKKQKRSRMTEELEDLNPWPTENPESAEKHPAKGIFARVEGPRRRTRDVLSDQVRAWQARLHGHQPCSNTTHVPQKPSSRSQDPALPDTLRQQPSDIEVFSESEEASQGRQSLGGDDPPGIARPGAATHSQFMLQDSEEQETMQLPRPGSGAQRPIFLLDSEDQDGLMQPDRTESPGQHTIHILDSENQDPPDQPGRASLPGPCVEGDGSAQAAAGCEESASKIQATGAVSHQEGPPVREAQTEEEFEAGIAHLPAKMQRELRGLQRPWHFDARLAEHPVNMAKFQPEHAKRQTRQPERFKFEGPSMGDGSDGQEGKSPTGQSTEGDDSDTASDEDELPLLNLVKLSVSPAAALASPVAIPWDSTTERTSQKEAASQQPAQPISPPDTILPSPTPAKTHKGRDHSMGQQRAACDDHPRMLPGIERVPSTYLEADMLGAMGMQAHNTGSPSPSAPPACLRGDRGAVAQGIARADSCPTRLATADDVASDGTGSEEAAPSEDTSASIAMLQAQHRDLQGGQPAASQAALQREGKAQLLSRKEREAKRLALFPSDRQREKNPPNEDRFLPRGNKRPRQPPAWLDSDTTSAKEAQHPGEGPQPGASAAVAQKEDAPPAACPTVGSASPADADMGAQLRMDLIPDSEDEA